MFTNLRVATNRDKKVTYSTSQFISFKIKEQGSFLSDEFL